MSTLLLKSIDDPRSPLDKAHRRELYEFAKKHGVAEITDETPAILARHILRQRGLTNIKVPPRILGAQNQPGTGMKYQNQIQDGHGAQPSGIEADMIADLARQFATQTRPEAQEAKPALTFNELRSECKRLGIKFGRKDNLATLREKYEAHGKNAP